MLELKFYLNGEDLGSAFLNFTGPEIFPAMSLNVRQSIRINFGHYRFQYPPDEVDGKPYSPVWLASRYPRTRSNQNRGGDEVEGMVENVSTSPGTDSTCGSFPVEGDTGDVGCVGGVGAGVGVGVSMGVTQISGAQGAVWGIQNSSVLTGEEIARVLNRGEGRRIGQGQGEGQGEGVGVVAGQGQDIRGACDLVEGEGGEKGQGQGQGVGEGGACGGVITVEDRGGRIGEVGRVREGMSVDGGDVQESESAGEGNTDIIGHSQVQHTDLARDISLYGIGVESVEELVGNRGGIVGGEREVEGGGEGVQIEEEVERRASGISVAYESVVEHSGGALDRAGGRAERLDGEIHANTEVNNGNLTALNNVRGTDSGQGEGMEGLSSLGVYAICYSTISIVIGYCSKLIPART